MDFKQWLLTETPIDSFQLLGNWNTKSPKYGYDKKDIGILTNPKAVEKIKKIWSSNETRFNLYFLRQKGASKIRPGYHTSEDLKAYGIDIQPEEGKVSVIYTGNQGGDRMPMTAWIIAHRLAHSLFNTKIFDDYFRKPIQRELTEIIFDQYNSNDYLIDKKIFALAKAISTFKSARDNKLINFNEFLNELVAQWIVTNKIIFNPLPKTLVFYSFGKNFIRLKPSEHNDFVIQRLQNDLELYLDSIFSYLEEKIVVF